MKFIKLVSQSGLVAALLMFPLFCWASSSTTTSAACTCGMNNPNPQPRSSLPLTFTYASDTLADMMAQNPLFVFFKVPANATSTDRSASYEHYAKLMLDVKQTTLSELSGATTGMIIDGKNYIVLDTSQLSTVVAGSFIINHKELPTTMQKIKALTVLDAALLDNEFVVIAFNRQNEGLSSSFAAAPTWAKMYM
ncbi:MAG: hypothetical protein V4496_03710, partial [Pseudomonadota bacterium]